MSVGISQVNFDAQALEDEDEEALEKEDQEREQEIRKLLDSELDDGLLDDDNASFSSHDFRSSSHSRDTPFSQDFSEQGQYPNLNDEDVERIMPSDRGAFERPPLITHRGVQLISRSRQGTDSQTEGSTQIQQPYENGHGQYQEHFNNQGYYDYQRDLESPQDGDGNDYQHTNGSGSNYRTTPEDDGLDEGFEPYGHYHPYGEVDSGAQGIQSHFPAQQGGYPYQMNQDSNEQGNEFPAYDYGGEYRQTGEEPKGMTQNFQDEGGRVQSNYNHYRIDTPGNYRVQYHGQGEAFSHLGQRGVFEGERRNEETSEMTGGIQEDSGETARDVVQLQILYKARGRKLEELSRKLEMQEEDVAKQIRVLNHQNALMKDERDGFSTSLEQSQKAVQGCNTEINNLKGQLAASAQQIHALKDGKDEALGKLHIAETTLDSLNQQLVELSRSESLSRAKEQHEGVVNAMKKKHEGEILTLKQKLDEAVLSREWKTEEANRLRDELVEKAEMINSLTRSLDSSQKQCQEILKTGTMSEINQLRLALQETSTARNVAEGQCISMKHELSELQEQVRMYDSAARLGVGSTAHSDSFAHLTVRNLNKENWATPKSHKLPLEETVSELRKELEQCLVSNKSKRGEVHKMETELNSLKEHLREQETKALRMEQIALEHEERANNLEKKVQGLESEKKDPDKELNKALEELELTRRNLEDSTRNLAETFREKEELSETCAELKQQMAQMVQEFDEDKRSSLEKCREACLQLHQEAKDLLREQLNKEHEQIGKGLRDELEEKNEELIRIKECYVQLSEESRGLEHNLREQFDKEKQSLLSERESEFLDELRSSLEKEKTAQIEATQEQWKRDERKRFEEEKQHLQKQLEAEKLKAVDEAVSLALKEWNNKHSCSDKQTDITDQITAARREWLKDHEDELERRLSNAIGEVRRIWDEEQKLKTKEEVEKVRKTLENAHEQSRDQELNRAVELALSHAHSDWLKNDEEMRQREIDQAVEVAITNAVAEAKDQWAKEIRTQDNVLQTCLAQERLRWKREEESERGKALEAAVAIAEVKWLEEEQKKISEAVEQAMLTARDTWQEEEEQDIAMAVEEARHEWNLKKEEEVNSAFESASSQLVEQFEEQKKVAVEKALSEARLQWEKKLSEQKGPGVESLREEIFKEFEEQRKAEMLETLEEAREAWNEEAEEQKQAEMNEAMAYLESQYAKGLDEFKHNELRVALEQARQQWIDEQRAHLEEAVQTRLTAAREEWRKELAQSTQVEVDRALSTAREAWAANYEDQLEERVSQSEKSVREKLEANYEEERKRLVEDTLREARTEFENEKRKLEEELRRDKGDEKWQDERTRLVKEHQAQVQRVRDEHESKLREECARIEKDLNTRMENVLEDARKDWDKERQDHRANLDRQNEQRTRDIMENARQERQQHQQKEVTQACEQAVKRQQELWANERRENQSALEKVKRELAALKKEYATSLECLKREVLEERKKTQHTSKRRDSRDYATQTALKLDSGSDTSFSSVDHVTATRGLHELRQQYLDSIAKIRDDVLDHVNQTKTSAAKKIRGEVLKERHSTAKKLRRYYLQCLKQLLEEDRIAMEANSLPSSSEDKLKRMAVALKTPSPSKESSGQPSPQPSHTPVDYSPRSGVFREVRSCSEPDIREARVHSTAKYPGRPRDCGPDGASDSPRLSGKERDFTPMLGDYIKKDSFEQSLPCHSPDRKSFFPERDSKALSRQNLYVVSKEKPNTHRTYNLAGASPLLSPVHKRVTEVNSEVHQRQRTISDPSTERDRQRNTTVPVRPEHIVKQKPLAFHGRSAPSPAFSVASFESDQYSELPTVIHVPKRDSSGVTRDHESTTRDSPVIMTNSPVKPPVRDMRGRSRNENRISKLVSRDKLTGGSPCLPSKPRVDVSGNSGGNRVHRS